MGCVIALLVMMVVVNYDDHVMRTSIKLYSCHQGHHLVQQNLSK